MKRRYGIAVSAMILAIQFSGPAHTDEPSIGQLEQIAMLLDSNDVQGTRAFIEQHPELLEGESELARLLRQYMEESDNPIDFIGRSPNSIDDRDHGDGATRLRAALSDPGARLEALDPEDSDTQTVDRPEPGIALY